MPKKVVKHHGTMDIKLRGKKSTRCTYLFQNYSSEPDTNMNI